MKKVDVVAVLVGAVLVVAALVVVLVAGVVVKVDGGAGPPRSTNRTMRAEEDRPFAFLGYTRKWLRVSVAVPSGMAIS